MQGRQSVGTVIGARNQRPSAGFVHSKDVGQKHGKLWVSRTPTSHPPRAPKAQHRGYIFPVVCKPQVRALIYFPDGQGKSEKGRGRGRKIWIAPTGHFDQKIPGALPRARLSAADLLFLARPDFFSYIHMNIHKPTTVNAYKHSCSPTRPVRARKFSRISISHEV